MSAQHSPRVAIEADRDIGARIRGYRLALNLTQADLGARIGTTLQQVQKYEKGENRVPASRLVEIAEILNVNLVTLATGRDKEADDTTVQFLGTPEGPRIIAAFMRLSEAERAAAVAVIEAMAATLPGK
jgi:transcriptional regulator with XRE-family HTH domain